VRLDAKTLAERLTLAGIEVGAVTPVAAPLEHVVVGEILSIAPHPQADRLRVCQVNVGQKAPLTIVCGAVNAATGLKVPVALEGALLAERDENYPERDSWRGILRHALCRCRAGPEESSQGLLMLETKAKPVRRLLNILQLDDQQLEIELTPNRGDCLSIIGTGARACRADRRALHTTGREAGCSQDAAQAERHARRKECLCTLHRRA